MAQITLIFNEEEREDAELAMKARAMHGILQELDEELRSRLKYEEHSDEARAAYDDIRAMLHDLIQEARLPF